MSAAGLIRRCREAGVELVADGDRLRVRGARRKRFLDELREHKGDVLTLLRQLADGDAEPSPGPDPIAADPAEYQNWGATPEPERGDTWQDDDDGHAAWLQRTVH